MTMPKLTIQYWLEGIRRQGLLQVQPVSLLECPDWPWHPDVWQHKTGRYFSVVGVRATVGHRTIEQPMIDQPEIGILGFIVRHQTKPQWLLQAKTEPGNVHGTQAGPSVQATKSNYQRVHGGRATPMIECFLGSPPGTRIWSDSLQSEQGDRFLGKYNRNVLAEIPTTYPWPAANPQWAWFDAQDVRGALLTDFAINTDARSVLVCSPWRWLTDDGGTPFGRWQAQPNTWGYALWHSHQQEVEKNLLDRVHADLELARVRWQVKLQRCSLTDLIGWHIDADGLHAYEANTAFCIQAFTVNALDREIPRWSQPLVVGGRLSSVTLLCARFDGVLRVLLREAAEPGFKDGVQLGPSDIDAPAHDRLDWVRDLLCAGIVVEHVAVHQSDEGGRFMNSVTRYVISETDSGSVPRTPLGAHWFSLAELQVLAQASGLLTNEARSALSLLLAWV